MNIQNDINTMLCPIKSNSNTIELTAHTSFYLGLRLTLCYRDSGNKKQKPKLSDIRLLPEKKKLIT